MACRYLKTKSHKIIIFDSFIFRTTAETSTEPSSNSFISWTNTRVTRYLIAACNVLLVNSHNRVYEFLPILSELWCSSVNHGGVGVCEGAVGSPVRHHPDTNAHECVSTIRTAC